MAGPVTRDSARTETNAFVSGMLQWTLLYGQSVIHAMRQSVRTTSLSHRVIQRVSQGEVSPAILQESIGEFVRSRGGDYASSITGLHERFLSRLVDLSLERAQKPSASELAPAQEFVDQVTRLSFALLNDLTDVRTKYQEDCLREALSIGTPAGGHAITLVAEIGTTASASLSVAGTAPSRTTVRCIATDVRRADGVGPAFVPAIVITPNVLEVDPGAEAVVAISLPLDDSLYQPDALYVGDLQIVLGSESRIDVPLRITATRPARQ
jgi:hypothetical protein